jgi:Ni/Co efflux regulator RcnB
MLYNHRNYIFRQQDGLVIPMRVFVRDHARKRMFERGISMEELTETIRKGRKWREGDTLHSTMRNIEVVYTVADSVIYVITVHYR